MEKAKKDFMLTESITGNDYLATIDELVVDKSFTNDERSFILLWLEYKNIVVVASMMGIDNEAAQNMLANYNIRQEINRLTKIQTQKRFATKMISVDQIESYLSSMITDENVSFVDRLSSKEKLDAIKLLMSVKEFKSNMVANPSEVIDVSLDDTIKNMSINSIKSLLNSKKDNNNRKALVDNLSALESDLNADDVADLQNMSTEELLKIVDKLNK